MLSSTQFNELRHDMDEALKVVADKYGVDIVSGNISYTAIDATVKVSLTKRDIAGKSYEQTQFELYAGLFGLSPSDYGKEFSAMGRRFCLVGFKPKSPKYQVVGVDDHGKRYKFPKSVIKAVI